MTVTTEALTTTADPVTNPFDPSSWRTVDGFEDLQDTTYHRGVERDDDGAVVRDLP